MAVNYRQRGKPTYRRNKIKWVFDDEELEADLMNIAKEFGKKYVPNAKLEDLDFSEIGNTDFGPHMTFNFDFDAKGERYSLRVGCFRDGWHITLKHRGEFIDRDAQIAIFGELNQDYAWTQETEKVVPIMGEIYQETMEYET